MTRTVSSPYPAAALAVLIQCAVTSEGQPGPLILNKTFAHLLGGRGYEVNVQGKTDIASGSHSPHARVTSWTEEVQY